MGWGKSQRDGDVVRYRFTLTGLEFADLGDKPNDQTGGIKALELCRTKIPSPKIWHT